MDPRQRRTRTRLRTALLDLMKQTHIDEIRVVDLVDRADIALPTFYRNYKSKLDLLHDTILNITDFFDAAIYDAELPIKHLLQADSPPPALPLLIYIEQQKTFFKHLLQTPYVHLILQAAHTKAREVIQRNTPGWTSTELDLITGCIVGNIYQWVILELPYTATELAQKIHHITLYGVLLSREEYEESREFLRTQFKD